MTGNKVDEEDIVYVTHQLKLTITIFVTNLFNKNLNYLEVSTGFHFPSTICMTLIAGSSIMRVNRLLSTYNKYYL